MHDFSLGKAENFKNRIKPLKLLASFTPVQPELKRQGVIWILVSIWGFPGGSRGKNQFDPWVEKIPWRRAWQPTPVFLPGEFHGQRSLVRYSSWDRKESDMTETT